MADTAAAKKKSTNSNSNIILIDKKALRARLENKKRRVCEEARQRKFAERMAELHASGAMRLRERERLAQIIADGERNLAELEAEIGRILAKVALIQQATTAAA